MSDVNGQAPGLNDTAVGPAVGSEVQATAGDQAATGIHDVSGGDVESAGSDVQHGAASVQEAAHEQSQIRIGAFDATVAVIQHATNLETGDSTGTEGTQFPALVVKSVRCDIEHAVAFDDARAVVERSGQAQVNQLAGDLPGTVVKVTPRDIDLACGVQAATAVIEATAVDDYVACLRRNPSALIVYPKGCQIKTLALGNTA
ncbi:hypothetical protein D3C77_158600 [compost metagenome]